ncbi:calcium/calmodulin-dependent protein kinase type II delta chain-like [Syngnathus typhle]
MLWHLCVALLSLGGIGSSPVSVQWAANSSQPVTARQQEIIQATVKLLSAVASGDYDTYREMSHPALSSFEPESLGVLVRGLEFHRFLMQNNGAPGRAGHTVVVEPLVHMLSEDAACIAYVRLTLTPGRRAKAEETRIWRRGGDGTWRHVHFHRSVSVAPHTN